MEPDRPRGLKTAFRQHGSAQRRRGTPWAPQSALEEDLGVSQAGTPQACRGQKRLPGGEQYAESELNTSEP
eukprot:NODE_7124_length_587_cov_2.752788_g6124_i0.p2 GENE.NODE_7124_length_587_cov_2.752788_g6124_i0~~NODE_7124_length_587_cov_2.752788_g6124_i0.p2  ORF type:complete len:71 (+),score=6.36 NODE_7124_length_587_cov_2.752788_g6124_i0:243-455(+)